MHVRDQFPALATDIVLADGPAGTQVPRSVIDAMTRLQIEGVSNLGGEFPTSIRAEQVVRGARAAVADLFGCASSELVFGANMTTLTFAVSRALAATWRSGDNVVVTRLDHDANITPWVRAASEQAIEVRGVDFDADTGLLDLDHLADSLNERTRLVAVTCASNALGSLVDVSKVAEAAHAVGALVYADAVHYAPHEPVDVESFGIDFLVASPYKFYGPHSGVLYGKAEELAKLDAFNVRPAPSDAPGKFETGTPSFATLAGVEAAVDYIASLGDGEPRREAILAGYRAIRAHEHELGAQFLDGVGALKGCRVIGQQTMANRVPTFALTFDGKQPADVVSGLSAAGIAAWGGHMYALELVDHLGLTERGGVVRIGFMHYNTQAEVERIVGALGAV